MFYGASVFVEDVRVWNVCKVQRTSLPDGNFGNMFTYSGQPDTNLEPDANGPCIACPNVCLTSGSGEYVYGQNPCTPVPSLSNGGFNNALFLWFSNQPLAASTYGNITDW
jgi:hypothetical protein